jgi:hypothetical protein
MFKNSNTGVYIGNFPNGKFSQIYFIKFLGTGSEFSKPGSGSEFRKMPRSGPALGSSIRKTGKTIILIIIIIIIIFIPFPYYTIGLSIATYS